jgi:hypothetical protein
MYDCSDGSPIARSTASPLWVPSPSPGNVGERADQIGELVHCGVFRHATPIHQCMIMRRGVDAGPRVSKSKCLARLT